MKPPIFINKKQQETFDKNGFIKIQLLDSACVEKLNALQKSIYPEQLDSFLSSSYLNNAAEKERISNDIVSLIMPCLKKHFKDFRSIGAAFLIKGVGEKSEMPMHQDWTIVDESKFYSLNIWIPLVATDTQNGTLEVCPGSHAWMDAKRAPTLPFPFQGHEQLLKENLVSINCIPGEVVVLSQALVHYSRPNKSSSNRPAITTGIVSKEAKLRLYYWDKTQGNQLEEYEQEDNFLLRFEDFHKSIFEAPKLGKKVKTFPYELRQAKKEEVLAFLDRQKTKPRFNFFKQLFGSHAKT